MISVLLLTGQSGSGKSTAMKALEDAGYLCVDNLPASLAEQLVRETLTTRQDAARLALAMDVRSPQFLEGAGSLVQRMRTLCPKLRLVYFEADEASLVRRYSETRRKHPLDRGSGLRAALEHEKTLLSPLRELADETIDTSRMTAAVLRRRVAESLAGVDPQDDLHLLLLSFGFKHGIPLDADLVFDVRFLPNPYFDDALRGLTGLDVRVQEFLRSQTQLLPFLMKVGDLLGFLIPLFRQEGKRYLTVAMGCTGGQHRSVAICQMLSATLLEVGTILHVSHRDLPHAALQVAP